MNVLTKIIAKDSMLENYAGKGFSLGEDHRGKVFNSLEEYSPLTKPKIGKRSVRL